MSANSNNNWQEQLRRWLTGDSTRRDELRLDQAAQNDPFLADALEGYRALSEENHVQRLTQMKAKLRGTPKRNRRGLVWRVAAVGAFLLIALWGIQQMSSVNEHNIAQSQKTATTPIVELSFPENQVPHAAEKITNDLVKKSEAIEQRQKKENVIGFEGKAKENRAKTNKLDNPRATVIDAPVTVEAEAIEEDAVSNTFNNEVIVAKDEVEAVVSTTPKEMPSALDEAAFDAVVEPIILGATTVDEENIIDTMSNETLDAFTGRMVKGKVLSDEGEPLIGATIALTGTPSGTMTDFNGDFRIQIPKNISSVDISYTGYENLRVYLEEEEELAIRLNESKNDLASVEAAASRVRTKRKSSALPMEKLESKQSKKITKPTPKGGIAKFEKYLLQNLRYPEAAKGRGKTDTVKVQFKVSEDGALSEIKVLNPVGFGIEEEAIRLLEEGPKWKADQPTLMTYEIIFKEW